MQVVHATAEKGSPGLEASLAADSVWLQYMENACFGGGLPAEAEAEMQLAGANYYHEDIAEQHMLRACELAPEHPATYIGLYRFYFYRNRLNDALAAGIRCLEFAARANEFSTDWRQVQPDHADFTDYGSVLPRFYLFTLKGCAYLNLRLGRIEEGRALLDKLSALDPSDRLGGSVLQQVLARMGKDDDE